MHNSQHYIAVFRVCTRSKQLVKMESHAMMMSIITSMIVQNSTKSAIGLLVSIVTLIVTVFQKDILAVSRGLARRVWRRSNFTVTARISTRNNSVWGTSYPKSFLAINRKLQQYALASKRPLDYEVLEFEQGSYGYSHPTKDASVTFFRLERPEVIEVEPGIYLRTHLEKVSGEKDYVYTTLTIKVESSDSQYASIKRFVDQAVCDYESALLASVKSQHVFVFDSENQEDGRIVYKEIPFETTKSFDNMFFDQKTDIIRAIDNFTHNKAEYDRLGIPHTLGFLFHGIRGSGKTSCAKSISKHTGRHVVIIPMKRIPSVDTLKKIFFDKEMNGVQIPNDKRLYVFEEIDCGTWASVVQCRSIPPTQHASASDDRTRLPTSAGGNGNAPMSDASMLAELVAVLKSDADDDRKSKSLAQLAQQGPNGAKHHHAEINLGEFLELLDGMVEIPGRMIIMTSNRAEMLDKALIRPGRIDHVIEFGKMSKQQVGDMYRLWFHRDIPDATAALMEDRVFTQAELGNLFASRDPLRIHAELANRR